MGSPAFSHPLVTRKCSDFLCNALDEPTQQAATVILTIITPSCPKMQVLGMLSKAPPMHGPNALPDPRWEAAATAGKFWMDQSGRGVRWRERGCEGAGSKDPLPQKPELGEMA